jgi:hypothetical protein
MDCVPLSTPAFGSFSICIWCDHGCFLICMICVTVYAGLQLGFSKLKHTNIHKRLHTTHKLFFCGGRRGDASRTGFVAQVWISVWKKSHVIVYVREYVRAVCWPDFNFENPKFFTNLYHTSTHLIQLLARIQTQERQDYSVVTRNETCGTQTGEM